MATDLNSAAGVNAASEAFRKCSADLIRGIQDPELLAWELYSDDVVSETVVDEVSVVRLSSVQRKTKLLSAVRDQIAVDPAKFQNLLLALRKQPPLKDVADKLETIYSNCGMCKYADVAGTRKLDISTVKVHLPQPQIVYMHVSMLKVVASCHIQTMPQNHVHR